MLLLSIATCSAVISWMTIVITHLKFRKYCREHKKTVKFRTPFYPVINYICIAFLIGVVAFMTQIPDMQLAVVVLPIWLFVLWIGYRYKMRRG